MKPFTPIGVILMLCLLVLLSTGVHAQSTENPREYSYIAFMQDGGLYVLDVNPQSVSALSTFDLSGLGPAWSPDGRRIAFRSPILGEQYARDVFILDIDGSRLTEITRELLPPDCRSANWRWTPDGNHIAFSCPQSGDWEADIYIMVFVSTDGQTSVEVLPFEIAARCEWFDFSVDGQQLVCGGTNETEFTHHITIIDLDSGDIRLDYQKMVAIAEDVLRIEVLNEGQILIWYFYPSQFVIIDFEGKVLHVSTPGLIEQLPLTDVLDISLSPDARRIVLGAANTSLAILDLDTESIEILYTSEPGETPYSPDWSPTFEEPLDLPDEPYTIDYMCALLEESGGHCGLDSASDTD